MAADCSAIQALLTEAQSAYHDLMVGKSVRKFVDQNNESVEYSRANISQLSAYIQDLKSQLAECGGGTPAYAGPIRFLFGRRTGY